MNHLFLYALLRLSGRSHAQAKWMLLRLAELRSKGVATPAIETILALEEFAEPWK